VEDNILRRLQLNSGKSWEICTHEGANHLRKSGESQASSLARNRHLKYPGLAMMVELKFGHRPGYKYGIYMIFINKTGLRFPLA
jgi:hypothetical protein